MNATNEMKENPGAYFIVQDCEEMQIMESIYFGDMEPADELGNMLEEVEQESTQSLHEKIRKGYIKTKMDLIGKYESSQVTIRVFFGFVYRNGTIEEMGIDDYLRIVNTRPL